jgi:nucleotidyltransferase substrate binding protein (TIGR01987 family)
MSPDESLKRQRVAQRLLNLTAAHERLKDALSRDTSQDEVLRAGLIQIFEFTFELCWKSMKDMLEVDGLLASAPRAVLREAFQQQYVVDGKTWMEMLDARNRMSHLYDEQEARKADLAIRSKYAPLINDFYDFLTTRWPRV